MLSIMLRFRRSQIVWTVYSQLLYSSNCVYTSIRTVKLYAVLDRITSGISLTYRIDWMLFKMRWCWLRFCINSKSATDFSRISVSVSALFSSDNSWSLIAAFESKKNQESHYLRDLRTVFSFFFRIKKNVDISRTFNFGRNMRKSVWFFSSRYK